MLAQLCRLCCFHDLATAYPPQAAKLRTLVEMDGIDDILLAKQALSQLSYTPVKDNLQTPASF
ncbi:hypothetical protein [Thiobacillus denitrificans]|uniref:hypothetical protein n=1 Tax=Thiobacillus denitrificans TaxID=36861 RepID=UPI0012FAABC8|nr:hypothetical protein [Thiobacillus denitrificans]